MFHVRFPGLGLEFVINNVAFTIGTYRVYWYGLIITAGLLLALLYAWRRAITLRDLSCSTVCLPDW